MGKVVAIYCLCNEFNIPFYIGKSNQPIRRVHFHKKKYGNDIKMEILDNVSIECWVFWEKHYISLYKSWGFILLNKNNGGGGPTSWDQKQKDQRSKILKEGNHTKYYTQSIREKMSNSSKGVSNFEGHKHNHLTKEKMSIIKLGKNIHTKESKKAISVRMKLAWETNINLKNRKYPKENIKRRKLIMQYSLDGTLIKQWNGIVLAANTLKINKRGICNCCLNISKQSGGFIWTYK